MCNKKTDEQIGEIVRGALGEIVDLMAKETHDKLLGLPRYEKVKLEFKDSLEIRGFLYQYGIIYKTTIEERGLHVIAVFMDERNCDHVIILLNREVNRGA